MRVLKLIVIGFFGLLLVASIGAYIFFKKAFTPDPNYLELTESSGFIPIKWVKSKDSDVAALLLPVRIKGIPDTFYMQFDTGAPSSLLYKQTMLSIQEKYPDHITEIDSTSVSIDESLLVGEMEVHSTQFKLYERGEKPIDWSRGTKIKIGTLGADMIDEKLTVFDFKNHYCYFGEEAPDFGEEIVFYDLKYKLRKVLLPAVVAGKERDLLHDSGTSGFELITNERDLEIFFNIIDWH